MKKVEKVENCNLKNRLIFAGIALVVISSATYLRLACESSMKKADEEQKAYASYMSSEIAKEDSNYDGKMREVNIKVKKNDQILEFIQQKYPEESGYVITEHDDYYEITREIKTEKQLVYKK